MKKIIKVLGIIILGFVGVNVLLMLICHIPIKKISVNIGTADASYEELVKDEYTQIYVNSSMEYPNWKVIGKDGVKFKGGDDFDYIFIAGNFPHEMNYDLIDNTFVLNGRYIGEKRLKNTSTVNKCFYVDSWGVLGQVKRGNGYFKNLSRTSLTIADKVFAQPFTAYDLEQFEDVDDLKQVNKDTNNEENLYLQ